MANEKRYPSTNFQRSIYAAARDSLSTITVPLTIRLSGPLDKRRLHVALCELIGHHEALRTRLVIREETLWQVVSELEEIDIDEREVSAAGLTGACRAEFGRPFDLRGPLVRAVLFRLGHQDHVLALAAHHTIMDGWSELIVVRDLAVLYAGGGLEAPALPFGDYATWEQRAIGATQLAYWENHLSGAGTRLQLGPRELTAGDDLVSRVYALPEVEFRLVALLARQYRVSVMALMAGLAVTGLWGYISTPALIGVFVGNRERGKFANTVGFIADIIPLRVEAPGIESLEAIASRMADAIQDCEDHRVPLAAIRHLVGRDDAAPLFDVILNYLPTAQMSETRRVRGLSITGALLEATITNRVWWDGIAPLDFRWRVRDEQLLGYLVANGVGDTGGAASVIAERIGALMRRMREG